MSAQRWKDIAASLLLVLMVLGIRALLIGQPPFTDEGNYAALAWFQYEYPFRPLPSTVTLSSVNLYPLALAWVCGLPGNCLFNLRVADALVMVVCALMFYRLLRRLTGVWPACGVTVLWVLCTNHPLFINAGFKNPYAAGFAWVFAAFSILLGRPSSRWALVAGICLALAFLCREPLIAFAAPALLLAWLGRSRGDAVRCGAGIGVGIAVGLVLMAAIRGGDIVGNLQAMVQGWHDLAAMYATLFRVDDHFDRLQHGVNQVRATWECIGWSLPIWVGGAIIAVVRAIRVPADRPVVLTGLMMVLAPLPEFILKHGFPYHLSAALAGLALLTVVAARSLNCKPHWRSMLVGAGVGAVIWFVPAGNGGTCLRRSYDFFADAARWSRRMGATMARSDWHSPAIADSFYLDTARQIRNAAGSEDTLMISGFYGAFYPLSGVRPAHLDMQDLSTFVLSRGLTLSLEERRRLNEAPPTLFIETNRFATVDLHGYFDDFDGRYELVADIATSPRHYGQFAGRLWRLKSSDRKKP